LRGKTNYWAHVLELYGANSGVDQGLAGSDMPAPGNPAQPMNYVPAQKWFTAVGIPITPRTTRDTRRPIDDATRGA
jgi:hypothetical protein